MTSFPKRTGVTRLSDDELLLFDFLFDAKAEERFLRRDTYSLHMNVGYSHDLNDEQLHDTLERLTERGLVVAHSEDGVMRWSLTPEGGAQWELERMPRWEAYCIDSEKDLRSGRPVLTVLSPSRSTAERFWKIGVKARLWTMGDASTRKWRIRNHQLIPWRHFSAIYVLAARGAGYGDLETDWEEYEASRTWWRNVTELNSLRKQV